MSWFSDFDKMNFTTKSVALSIVASIPFWAIQFYLFKKYMYLNGDYIVIAAFCLCFSVAYYVLYFGVAAAVVSLDEDDMEDKEDIALVGIAAVGNLCTWIVLAYFFNWSFMTLLIIEFGLPLLIFVFLFVAVLNQTESKPEQKTEAETKTN